MDPAKWKGILRKLFMSLFFINFCLFRLFVVYHWIELSLICSWHCLLCVFFFVHWAKKTDYLCFKLNLKKIIWALINKNKNRGLKLLYLVLPASIEMKLSGYVPFRKPNIIFKCDKICYSVFVTLMP